MNKLVKVETVKKVGKYTIKAKGNVPMHQFDAIKNKKI